jgi:hypothetical protein
MMRLEVAGLGVALSIICAMNAVVLTKQSGLIIQGEHKLLTA